MHLSVAHVALLVACGIIVALGVIAGASFGPMLLAVYAASALLHFVVPLTRFLGVWGDDSGLLWKDRDEVVRRRAQITSSWRDVLRFIVMLAREAAAAALWPTLVVEPRREPPPRTGSRLRWEDALDRLHPPMACEAMTLFVVVLVVFGAQLRIGSGDPGFSWLYWIVVAAVMVRLASYVLGGRKPFEILKRGTGDPIVHLVGVAVGTYGALVVCLLALSVDGDASALSLAGVGAVISHLNVKSWVGLGSKIVSGALIGPGEYIIALTGVLVNVSIIASLWKVKELKRRKDDFLDLAWASVMVSQIDRAAHWCRRVPEHERDQGWLSLMLAIAFARGELDKALDYATSLAATLELRSTPDKAYRVMAISASVPVIPTEHVRKLLHRWILFGADDAHLCDAMLALSGRLPTFDPDEALEPYADLYPLTQAQLHVVVGEHAQVFRLIGSIEGLSPFGEIQRLQVLLGAGPDWNATLRDESVCATLRGHLTTSLGRIRQAVNRLGDRVERSSALQGLNYIATRAEQLGSATAGEYRALLPVLIATTTDDEERSRLEREAAAFPQRTAVFLEREATRADRNRLFYETYVKPFRT